MYICIQITTTKQNMKKHKPPTTPYTIRVSTELLKKSTPELRVKITKIVNNYLKKQTWK